MNIYRRWKHKFFSTSFLVLLLCGMNTTDGIAAGSKSLTWEECVKSAQMNNPDVISAKESILQYAAERKIVRADLLPQISASASGGRNGTESGITGKETTDSFYYGVSAKQLIFDGFKSIYDLKSAGAGLEKSRLQYQVTSAEVRYKLRNAYINYLKSKEMLKIAQEIEARRKHIYDLVRLRYNAGKEHIGSLHSTEADLLQAKADTVSASRDLSLANTSLCRLIGFDESTQLEIEGPMSVPADVADEPDFASLALKTPSVMLASSAKDAAYYSLQASRLDFSPKLYGNASVGRQGESMSDMSNEWSVGFEVTAPLFEGGKTYYSVSKASAAHRQAEADERSAKNSALSSLRESWSTLKNSLDTVGVQKLTLKATTERSNIGEMQYSIGTLSFDNWTIIENNLASAKKSYINASASALTAEAAWIQSKGGILEDENKN